MRQGVESIGGAYLTGARAPGVASGLVSIGIEGWEPRQIVEELWNRWKIAGRAVPNPAAVRLPAKTLSPLAVTVICAAQLTMLRPAVVPRRVGYAHLMSIFAECIDRKIFPAGRQWRSVNALHLHTP